MGRGTRTGLLRCSLRGGVDLNGGMGARGPAGPSTCAPEPGDGPTLGLGRRGSASKGTAGGSSRSAGLHPRRRGEELRGRGGTPRGRGDRGRGLLSPARRSCPRLASPAGPGDSGRGGAIKGWGLSPSPLKSRPEGRGHQGAGRDAASLRSCPCRDWTDATGQPGRTRAAATSLPRTTKPHYPAGLFAQASAARMGRKVTVATCALNQWALDFEGNLQRILKSESRVGVGWTGEGQLWSPRFAVTHTQPCSGETCGHGYRDPE